MKFVFAFVTGGLICVIGQLLIDKTGLTPARILTLFVVSGVVLSALGLYQPLVDLAGAGATVPISGFGNLMAEGMKTALRKEGALGIFTGSFESAAAGVGAVIAFSVLAGMLFKPRGKQ